MTRYNCLTVLGPTASGKTSMACRLAYHLNGEIISADSRQVYRGLDIGTGKDLGSYHVNEKEIRFHLIDVADPKEQYYLHDYMAALQNTFNSILSRQRLPVICGGTGMYLDALRKDFSLTQIAEDPVLRERIANLEKEALLEELKKYPSALTAHVDKNSVKRIIRGIEVATYLQQHPEPYSPALPYHPFYLGIDISAEERKKNIKQRLHNRISDGLIEEVESLLISGVSHERLQNLGLEYKFVSLFLQDKISKEEMIDQLRTAIIQFSKRQMTWFRKMEREGVKIRWVDKDADPGKLADELRSTFSI